MFPPTRRFHLLLLLLLIASSLWALFNADSTSKDFLGIAPQDEWYFKSDVIKCKDGSKKFTRDRLNDEFCDCPDGTDEPGTSACPEGKFYCRNVGHTPILIFSSRVNDGICDCCDGSDEYNGKTKCSNTCWEAGKVARDRLKKRIATFKEGIAIRKAEVQKAQDAFSKDEADLSKLKNDEKELKGLVQKLKEHKEQIEKAEEQERLKREKEEKRLKDLELKEKEAETPDNNVKQADEEHTEEFNQDKTDDSHGSSTEQEHDLVGGHEPFDGHEVIEKGQQSLLSNGEPIFTAKDADAAQEDSINPEGLSKEELGRRIASRWTGEKVDDEKIDNVDAPAKHDEEEQNIDFPETAEGEDYDAYNSETDDDNDKYDDNDFDDKSVDDGENDEHDNDHHHDIESEEKDLSDYTTTGSQSWLGKIQQKVQNVLQAINLFKTPLNISEAARIRKEYDDASSKLSKMQSRISTLTEKLKHDFGKEKEFYLFYNHCFETKQNKYTYKVCPFKQASQVEGHSTTRLGSWDKFEESYRVLQFSNGDRCWNGPDRSLKVRLRCGLKNELTDVDEPSRCEYVAALSTPLLCLDAKLKELQEKLELLNSGQPFSHDEF